MKVEWMNHTGVSVASMTRALEFYKDTLGLEIEMDTILEGDFLDQLSGQEEARAHIVYLGNGDGRHSIEPVSYTHLTLPTKA